MTLFRHNRSLCNEAAVFRRIATQTKHSARKPPSTKRQLHSHANDTRTVLSLAWPKNEATSSNVTLACFTATNTSSFIVHCECFSRVETTRRLIKCGLLMIRLTLSPTLRRINGLYSREEVGASADGVVRKVLIVLLVAEILERIAPKQIAHCT